MQKQKLKENVWKYRKTGYLVLIAIPHFWLWNYYTVYKKIYIRNK